MLHDSSLYTRITAVITHEIVIISMWSETSHSLKQLFTSTIYRLRQLKLFSLLSPLAAMYSSAKPA